MALSTWNVELLHHELIRDPSLDEVLVECCFIWPRCTRHARLARASTTFL